MSILFINIGIDKNIIPLTIFGIILETFSFIILCILYFKANNTYNDVLDTIPVARVVDQRDTNNRHIVIGIPL